MRKERADEVARKTEKLESWVEGRPIPTTSRGKELHQLCVNYPATSPAPRRPRRTSPIPRSPTRALLPPRVHHSPSFKEGSTVCDGMFIDRASIRLYITLYIVFCLVGAALELSYGVLWSVVGASQWIYPSSPLHHTSLAVLPLWGFGGLICVSIYRALLHKKAKFLLMTIPPMAVAALWILAYSWFMA